MFLAHTLTEVAATQKGFNLLGAYPDIDRGIFGLTIDPKNPYRCFFFERWTGTNTGSIKIGSLLTLPPTGKSVETPIHISSIVWNPEGKIVYESISPPVDRFEGNTKGSGAVFGLLAGAGLQLPAAVGDGALMLQQRLNTDLLSGSSAGPGAATPRCRRGGRARRRAPTPTISERRGRGTWTGT